MVFKRNWIMVWRNVCQMEVCLCKQILENGRFLDLTLIQLNKLQTNVSFWNSYWRTKWMQSFQPKPHLILLKCNILSVRTLIFDLMFEKQQFFCSSWKYQVVGKKKRNTNEWHFDRRYLILCFNVARRSMSGNNKNEETIFFGRTFAYDY